MSNTLIFQLSSKQVALIVQAFLSEEISYEQLKTWAVWAMDSKERYGFLEYSAVVRDIVLAIEMSEEHEPITLGMARDFLKALNNEELLRGLFF